MKNKQCLSYDCWVDSINLLSLAALAFLRFRYNYRAVRYLRISKFSSRIIGVLGLVKIFKLKGVMEDCPEMTSSEEREIYHQGYKDKSDLTLEIARRHFKDNGFADDLAGRYKRNKINFFFKQEIALDIADFMVISNFIRWFRNRESGSTFDIVLIRSTPWLDELAEFGRGLIGKVHGYPDLKSASLASFVPLKMIFEIIANSFLVIFSLNKMEVKNKRLPKVAVMHAHGAGLNKRSDYFWFPQSSIRPEQVLVYFKYDCWPPKKDSIKLIESYGMRWVDLLPWKLRGCSIAPELYRLPHAFFVKESLRSLLATMKLFLRCVAGREEFALWQWKGLVNLINRVSFYNSFFHVFNVKVHYSLYETGIDMIAANIAIESNGGLDLCHHWSNYDVTEISIGKLYDLYFTWGPFYKENFFDKDYYQVKYLVYTGYPYDFQFERSKKASQLYRQKLLNNGAKFIITFFDQSYPADWPRANADIEAVYRALLNYVIKDPDVGLIIKPKKSKDFMGKIKEFPQLAEEARKTGRVLYLDSLVFANEAASAADLVVGFGVYSTPALESALSGVPAVTCDLQNLSSHPFYRGGSNSMVFNKLESLLPAIGEFKNKTGDSVKTGDYSFILKEIDPFRDGMASRRIGRVVAGFIEEFDSGRNRLEALTNVLNKYSRQWGADKVCSTNFREGYEE